jgi:hypothetical protein
MLEDRLRRRDAVVTHDGKEAGTEYTYCELKTCSIVLQVKVTISLPGDASRILKMMSGKVIRLNRIGGYLF